jgi:hypothetical protein
VKKGKLGPADCVTREKSKMWRRLNLERATTSQKSTITSCRSKWWVKKKRIRAFFISKFLKFYGEEFGRVQINWSISSNTREKATCTVTGSLNLKWMHLADQSKIKSTASTKPSI